MLKPFDNIRDAVMRLDKIFVFFEGEPKYCYFRDQDRVSDTSRKVALSDIDLVGKRHKPLVVDYTDEGFEVGFPELGYMNSAGLAYYLHAVPGRSQKWGFTYHNIMRDSEHGLQRLDSSSVFKRSFVKVLKGEYPSLSRCITELNSNAASQRAFDREFRLAKIGNTIRIQDSSGVNVGTHVRDKVFRLNTEEPSYEYTRKILAPILEAKGGSIEEASRPTI